MADDEHEIQRAFARVRTFGWDEQKRRSNLRVHRIDFGDVPGIFDGYTFIRRSDRDDEVRYEIFGIVGGREVAVVWTLDDARCWIISARRASRKERQEYHNRSAGRRPERED
jgi:uncharacterized protein